MSPRLNGSARSTQPASNENEPDRPPTTRSEPDTHVEADRLQPPQTPQSARFRYTVSAPSENGNVANAGRSQRIAPPPLPPPSAYGPYRCWDASRMSHFALCVQIDVGGGLHTFGGGLWQRHDAVHRRRRTAPSATVHNLASVYTLASDVPRSARVHVVSGNLSRLLC